MDREEKHMNIGGVVSSTASQNQTTKYMTGKDGSTGHGFGAEDANALYDILRFNDVNKEGVKNLEDGADRITNGIKIQTKYCKSARNTVNAAFDPVTGMYRYRYQNGRPMKLEVPRDQYNQAVEMMRKKILDGKITGVKNPDHAFQMVRKGILTYEQSVKVTKAGTVESLVYDAATGTVACTASAGISVVVTYMAMKKQGASNKEALKAASKSGGAAALSTLVTQVLVGQAEKYIVRKVAQTVAKKATQKLTESAIREGAKAAVKEGTNAAVKQGTKSVTKGALSSLAKSSARTNIVTAVVTTAVTSAPDVYKACKGDISWKECGKRNTKNAVSVAGGIAASAVAVALMSNPVGWVAAGVGMVAGMGGSIASEKAFGKVTSLFKRKK